MPFGNSSTNTDNEQKCASPGCHFFLNIYVFLGCNCLNKMSLNMTCNYTACGVEVHDSTKDGRRE